MLHSVGVKSLTEKKSFAQVKMSLSCKNLAVSQSMGSQPPDPFAALYVADSRGHWEQVSKTEVVPNTRGNSQCPCPCWKACMYACLPACFTQPKAQQPVRPHQLLDQGWSVLMAMMPAQILTSRRHCTAPSSLSGRRDLKQSCCPRPQRAAPIILVCFHEALLQSSLMTAAILAVDHELCMCKDRWPEVKV